MKEKGPRGRSGGGQGPGGRSLPAFLIALLFGWLAWTSPAFGAGEVQELLAGDQPLQWFLAVQRLQASGDVPALLQLLRQDSRGMVRVAAAMALGKFREPRVLEALSQALKDQETFVRLGAIGALSFYGGEEVKGPLQEALKDKDQEVRQAAEQALAMLMPGKAVRFSTLERGTRSGIREPAAFIIRKDEEWKHLWDRHRDSDPPPVDFSREMVVAVFMGEQQTGGFAVEIEQVEEKAGGLQVLAKDASPTPGDPVQQVLTQPYHIIKLERKEGPIRVFRRPAQE